MIFPFPEANYRIYGLPKSSFNWNSRAIFGYLFFPQQKKKRKKMDEIIKAKKAF